MLAVFTVGAAGPSMAPWDSSTPGAFEFGVAFAAPFLLSTAFALRQLARGDAKRPAALYLWLGSAFLGLVLLFLAVAVSHVNIGS